MGERKNEQVNVNHIRRSTIFSELRWASEFLNLVYFISLNLYLFLKNCLWVTTLSEHRHKITPTLHLTLDTVGDGVLRWCPGAICRTPVFRSRIRLEDELGRAGHRADDIITLSCARDLPKARIGWSRTHLGTCTIEEESATLRMKLSLQFYKPTSIDHVSDVSHKLVTDKQAHVSLHNIGIIITVSLYRISTMPLNLLWTVTIKLVLFLVKAQTNSVCHKDQHTLLALWTRVTLWTAAEVGGAAGAAILTGTAACRCRAVKEDSGLNMRGKRV